MNTIIYTRVSTDEQADKGFSLRHQEQILKTYCKINNLKILNHYKEDFSAKNFNRPEWKKLMAFVKANKKTVDKVLFSKWDRFSRNAEEALSVIRKFNELGIEINSIEQPLDLSNPDNKVMLAMYLIIPEVENDKNSQRTKDGMRRAKKEGCFMGKAPFGYSNGKVSNKTSIVANDESKMVLLAYTEVAKGLEAVEVIRKRFKSQLGLRLEKQQFYNMLRNIIYAGMIMIPEYKKESAEIVRGIHTPIVSTDLFRRVQDVLDGRRNPNAKLPSSVNEAFPLKGNLICPKCGRLITASKSKGNGGHYEYYHCKSTCKVRHKKDSLHGRIAQLLDEITINKHVSELYTAILKDTIESNEQDFKAKANELEIELENINKMIVNAEDRLMSKDIDISIYTKITDRYSDNIRELQNRIAGMVDNDSNLKQYVRNSVSLLCNMGTLFNQLENRDKGSFLRVIYPENIIVENEYFRTNSENAVLGLLTRINRASQNSEIEKATLSNGFSNEAPPLGLEPRTL
ncbi:recombinase family protein [Flavobacterium sp.]|uniref:recombinase family protein n=1 Tax=Flavobacterium sp. TaxID=239 RepID=UPI00262E87E9|nr:recombinase family protein [Flavobacterium sp.]